MNPWTVAHQAPLSMGFYKGEYWSGLPFPSPVDLPDPGIEPRSPTSEADTLTSEPPDYFSHWFINISVPSILRQDKYKASVGTISYNFPCVQAPVTLWGA